MSNEQGIAACLMAAFLPVPNNSRKPVVKSRSLKEAIQRMEDEAVELQETVSGNRDLSETIKTITEHM